MNRLEIVVDDTAKGIAYAVNESGAEIPRHVIENSVMGGIIKTRVVNTLRLLFVEKLNGFESIGNIEQNLGAGEILLRQG